MLCCNVLYSNSNTQRVRDTLTCCQTEISTSAYFICHFVHYESIHVFNDCDNKIYMNNLNVNRCLNEIPLDPICRNTRETGSTVYVLSVRFEIMLCMFIKHDMLLLFRLDPRLCETHYGKPLTSCQVTKYHRTLVRASLALHGDMRYAPHVRSKVRPRQCLEISRGVLQAPDIYTYWIKSIKNIPLIVNDVYPDVYTYVTDNCDIYTFDVHADKGYFTYTTSGMNIFLTDNMSYISSCIYDSFLLIIATSTDYPELLPSAYKYDLILDSGYDEVFCNEITNFDELRICIFDNYMIISPTYIYYQSFLRLNTVSVAFVEYCYDEFINVVDSHMCIYENVIIMSPASAYFQCPLRGNSVGSGPHDHGDCYDTDLYFDYMQRSVAYCGCVHNSLADRELWRDGLSPLVCLIRYSSQHLPQWDECRHTKAVLHGVRFFLNKLPILLDSYTIVFGGGIQFTPCDNVLCLQLVLARSYPCFTVYSAEQCDIGYGYDAQLGSVIAGLFLGHCGFQHYIPTSHDAWPGKLSPLICLFRYSYKFRSDRAGRTSAIPNYEHLTVRNIPVTYLISYKSPYYNLWYHASLLTCKPKSCLSTDDITPRPADICPPMSNIWVGFYNIRKQTGFEYMLYEVCEMFLYMILNYNPLHERKTPKS